MNFSINWLPVDLEDSPVILKTAFESTTGTEYRSSNNRNPVFAILPKSVTFLESQSFNAIMSTATSAASVAAILTPSSNGGIVSNCARMRPAFISNGRTSAFGWINSRCYPSFSISHLHECPAPGRLQYKIPDFAHFIIPYSQNL